MPSVWYTVDTAGALMRHTTPPPGMRPLDRAQDWLLPPLVSRLHAAFACWTRAGHTPGPLTPERVWIDREGNLAIRFPVHQRPWTRGPVGRGADLAAWLVLLDHFMETFVVIARARTVWQVDELADALGFATPAFLPPALARPGTTHWEAVARALAHVVADGPLQAAPQERHWTAQRQDTGP